jgi:hypothetical protein
MKTIKMYYYFNQSGLKLWTSDFTLACGRARVHDSDVFEQEIQVQDQE